MDTIFGVPADTLMFMLLGLLALIFLGVGLTAVRYPLPFRLGIRNIPRRKSQTMLIVVGLALSTLIITSALGIGDTINYSVKVQVYDDLGAIDEEISPVAAEAAAGFSFSAAPNTETDTAQWFAAATADDVATLVDGETLDAAAPVIIQTLPVFNSASNLSEAAVAIRGLGEVTGDGLALPAGVTDLADDELLVNETLAEALDVNIGDELLLVKGIPTPFTVAGIVPDGELAGGTAAIIWTLAQAQTFFAQPDQITAILVSNVGDRETGVDLTESAVTRLETVTGDLLVNTVKLDQLDAAASSASFITTLFVTFGTFSIFSGILLIFLIFSVLAAERKSELGMSRAVGLQRSDLIRQFVSEGLAYNFMASAVGALLGVGAAMLLAQGIASLLDNSTLNIIPRVSLRSALIGYSLGLVITFATVSISAIRISRVNIIAAIRDLNLPTLPRESQWVLFLHPFIVWQAAATKAGKGNGREAIRLFLLAGPKAILNFWGGLLARGPVLLLLGYAFAYIGVNVAEQIGVYGMGVSLFIIGLGQLMNWLRVPERLAYSFVGLGLILYWALPTRSAGALADLGSNPGDFFISGLFLVGGAIVLFLFNADALLNLFAGLLGSFGRLLPVARVAIAYPVMNKGRTATTLAMFSLIIFTLVSTITITNTFSNFLDPIAGSGDYDVLVQANPFNPISVADLETAIETLVADGDISAPETVAAATFGPVKAQSPEMDAAASYLINGVDETFFATHRLELGGWVEGYESAEEVWAAVQNDASLILIDDFSVDRGGDPTAQRNDEAFAVTSISAAGGRFDPVTISLTGLDGVEHEFTIIGVISSAPNFFGATMNEDAAALLGYEQPNRFFLRLPEGDSARAAANAIEGEFSRSGLQTSLPKEQLEASRASVRSIFYLIQGFIGLGLLIGIAALGVVTIRAVVERRQQIGVLRAIGFSQGMVQNVFLFEGIFVTGLAAVIGYGLALTFSYNLYLQVAAEQGLAFLPPWGTLAGIGVAIIVASLLTAWLPARATAKVVIADALRYE
ncbi:MAG: ABC transporter permease [Chloroflexi bacterium]|nr:ABC transporter permease [Chloroflexota bacterium]